MMLAILGMAVSILAGITGPLFAYTRGKKTWKEKRSLFDQITWGGVALVALIVAYSLSEWALGQVSTSLKPLAAAIGLAIAVWLVHFNATHRKKTVFEVLSLQLQ